MLSPLRHVGFSPERRRRSGLGLRRTRLTLLHIVEHASNKVWRASSLRHRCGVDGRP